MRRSLREYVADPAARLLSRFGIHGIEATIRNATAIIKRVAGSHRPND